MKKFIPFLLVALLLTACGKKADQPLTPEVPEPGETIDLTHPEQNEQAMIEDWIVVDTPRIGNEIISPVTIRGEARGTWFFEGSFPLRIVDEEGVELGRAIATSTKSWMTEDFIPFEAKLDFDVDAGQKGQIILEKENPSGLPENDKSLSIEVFF